jgi:hypothetical protein
MSQKSYKKISFVISFFGSESGFRGIKVGVRSRRHFVGRSFGSEFWPKKSRFGVGVGVGRSRRPNPTLNYRFYAIKESKFYFIK